MAAAVACPRDGGFMTGKRRAMPSPEVAPWGLVSRTLLEDVGGRRGVRGRPEDEVGPCLATAPACISRFAAAPLECGRQQRTCCSSMSSIEEELVRRPMLSKCICEEPMASSEVHRGGSACAHAFCRACLAGHVRAKVESGGAGTVRCLDASCAGTLDPELCRAALPSDVFERWCAALCESMFLGARRTYCPFPDCSEMMVADDGCGGEEDAVTQSECQVCRRLFCAQCGVPWHAGADCTAYKKLGRGDTSREDVMLLEMATEKKWRRCPKCEFFVEKVDGCLHIVCRCEFEFCYGCGEKWRTSCSCPDEEDED